MQSSYDSQMSYGGFFVRLAAYVVDMLLVGIFLLFVRIPFGVVAALGGNPLSGGLLFTYSWKDIILYVCGVAYFILFTYCSGTTPGKRLFNLRVISTEGGRLTLVNVIYRETVGRFLSSVILDLGYFMIGIDKEKKGLHDVLCNTRVVYEKKIKVTAVPSFYQAPVQAPQDAGIEKSEKEGESHDETGGF